MFEVLQKRIGHVFNKPELLRSALVHPSCEPAQRAKSFQRLEFLGDRVLGLIIAESLYQQFPQEKEGELAKRLASLVCRECCHEVAEEINLYEVLSIETGEIHATSSVLADALEALIGAVYLDGGLEAARQFVQKYWQERLEEDKEPPLEPKTALQEWVQNRFKTTPHYKVLSITGPDHSPTFHVQVLVQGCGEAEATGPSKKYAERSAARLFIENYCHD